MSGTCTGTGPDAAGAATGAEATGAAATGATARAVGASATAAAGTAAAPAASTTRTTEPCLTLSPRATRISLTTPAVLDGISMEALSDSTVISDCSALTVSPTLTINSMTVTSSKSPMSGTCTSNSAICVSLFQLRTEKYSCGLSRKVSGYAYRGLILSALMPYFWIASATCVAGTAPSSLSALRAATAM